MHQVGEASASETVEREVDRDQPEALSARGDIESRLRRARGGAAPIRTSRVRRLARVVLLGVAAIVGLLTVSGLVYREIGLAKLEAVKVRIATEGGDATFWDYGSSFDVDEGLQDEFWRWHESFPRGTMLAGRMQDAVQEWVISRPGTPFPAAIADELTRHAASYEHGRALARNERLVMGTGGFARLDCGEQPTIEEVDAIRRVGMLEVRSLAAWMTAGAVRADDAAPWLDDLDAITRRFGKGSGLFMAILTVDWADAGYLLAAVRGNVDPARLEAWARSPVEYGPLAADELRRDRCLQWACSMRRSAPHSDRWFREINEHSWYRSAWNSWYAGLVEHAERAWEYVAVPHDVARSMSITWQLERRLRGDESVDLEALRKESEAYVTPYGMATRPSVGGIEFTIQSNVQLRARRIAALVLYDLIHRRRPLPADAAELESRWPDALRELGPDEPALTYRKLSRSRFRVCRADRPAEIEATADTRRGFGLCTQMGDGREYCLPDWMAERGEGDGGR